MPKAKISREMVVDAAFDITRREGIENVNARAVAERLGCSTQPVMYHFSKIEDMKLAVFEKADLYHSDCLMSVQEDQGAGIMLNIALNYIRFAIREPHLFRFLNQSEFAEGCSLVEMINSEGLRPILEMMGAAMKTTLLQTKEVFLTVAMFAHGYASIIANDTMDYNEKAIIGHLIRTYRGAVLAVKEGL